VVWLGLVLVYSDIGDGVLFLAFQKTEKAREQIVLFFPTVVGKKSLRISKHSRNKPSLR
jgi:hypothetical protein